MKTMYHEVSENSKEKIRGLAMNTDQGRYLLMGFDLATGLALVLSPRQKTPYRVYLYPRCDGRQCDCRGFQAHKRCRHTDLSKSVGWAIWQSAQEWESQSTASRCRSVVYSDFMKQVIWGPAKGGA